jgi:hypothetical protein
MNINVTIPIGKAPNNNKRIVVFYPICLPTYNEVTQSWDVELRLLCNRYELDVNDVRIESTAKLFTPTTIGEYVDSSGKKKDKADPTAQAKGDYYKNKAARGNSSIFEQYFDVFRNEIIELDKQGYFNT